MELEPTPASRSKISGTFLQLTSPGRLWVGWVGQGCPCRWGGGCIWPISGSGVLRVWPHPREARGPQLGFSCVVTHLGVGPPPGLQECLGRIGVSPSPTDALVSCRIPVWSGRLSLLGVRGGTHSMGPSPHLEQSPQGCEQVRLDGETRASSGGAMRMQTWGLWTARSQLGPKQWELHGGLRAARMALAAAAAPG